MSGDAELRPSAARSAEQAGSGWGPTARLRSLILSAFAIAAAGTLLGILAPSDGAAAAERHPAALGSLLGGAGDGLTSVIDSATDAVDSTVGGAVAVVDAAAPVAAPITRAVVEQVAAPLTTVVDRTTEAAVGAVVHTTAPVVGIVDEVVGELPALPGLPGSPALPAPEPPGTEVPAPTPPDLDPLPDVEGGPGLDPADGTAQGASPSAVLPASIVGGVGIAIAADPSASADSAATAHASTPSSAGMAVLRGSSDDPAADGPLAGDPAAVSSASAAAASVALGAATLDIPGSPHLDSGRTAPPRDERLPAGPSADSPPSPD